MLDQPKDLGEITFALASRLLTNGQIALVLHLHRGNSRALSTTLTTCDRQAAPNVLRTCRSHLRQRGLAERSRSAMIEARGAGPLERGGPPVGFEATARSADAR